MLKKFKEKFRKFIFLVPLAIGLLVIYFIKINEEVFKDFNTLYASIMLLAIILSQHHWRLAYSKKYQKKMSELRESERGKKWHQKNRYLSLSGQMSSIMIFLFGFSLFSFSFFLKDGISHNHWDCTVLFWAFICLLISFIFYKLLK
jgi:Na+/melibiose symporter-like transporter